MYQCGYTTRRDKVLKEHGSNIKSQFQYTINVAAATPS